MNGPLDKGMIATVERVVGLRHGPSDDWHMTIGQFRGFTLKQIMWLPDGIQWMSKVAAYYLRQPGQRWHVDPARYNAGYHCARFLGRV